MDDQESEILALSSIFEDGDFKADKSDGCYSGVFKCRYKLDSPFVVYSKVLNVKTKLNYLPPVFLYFTLPSDYPQKTKPSYTVSCIWMSPHQLSLICDHLNKLANENKGCEILFLWFMYLQNEVFESLELKSPIDMDVITSESESFLHHTSQNKADLNDIDICRLPCKERINECESFDLEQETLDLMSTPYTCEICLCDRFGRKASIVKPCRHLFCRSCIEEFFKTKINDGDIENILCPGSDCDSVIPTALIRSVVDDETFQRYDVLLLRKSLASLGELCYCPRISCQYPVLYEEGASHATCPSCSLTFCILCRRTYHGVSPCRFKFDEIEKLREKYLKADHTKRMELEKRYGKPAIKEAIDEYDSNVFLKENCTPCPHCSAWCQKTEGCNKMTCTKCKNYFCWLCGKILGKTNPYSHFRDPNTPCGGRLFEGADLNDDDVAEEPENPEADDFFIAANNEDDDFIIFQHLE